MCVTHARSMFRMEECVTRICEGEWKRIKCKCTHVGIYMCS